MIILVLGRYRFKNFSLYFEKSNYESFIVNFHRLI